MNEYEIVFRDGSLGKARTPNTIVKADYYEINSFFVNFHLFAGDLLIASFSAYDVFSVIKKEK